MKLPSFKRLFKTDYKKEFQALVDQLSFSLNNGIEVLYTALNHNLSLQDNVFCSVNDVTVTVDSSGTPQNTTIVKLSNNVKTVLGLEVIKATNLDNSNTYPSAAVFVSWIQTQDGLTINNVTGLQANVPYQIRIVVYG